ncbi:CBY1-interacting BAR domain-containing protein 1-like isoform X3 [Centruroides vittatus]
MIKNSLKSNDHQVDFILQRVKFVEKNISELCHEFASYSRKMGQLRDCGDSLANKVLNYAVGENLHHSLRSGLTKFAEKLAAVQDYRQAEIQRLEAKVILHLAEYGEICKQAKAEVALLKASNQATKSYKDLETKMDAFEQKKLYDLKRIFTQFVNIELLFHAKALEIYTKAHNDVNSINAEADLEEFRSCLRTPSLTLRSDVLRESEFPSKDAPELLSTSVKRKMYFNPEKPPSAEQSSELSDSEDDDEEDKKYSK